MLSTAIAHSIAFFSVDPRVVLVMGYMAEFRFHNPIYNSAIWPYLTDDIFETGAYGVPSKSQNPTVLGQGGSSKVGVQQL